MEYTFEEFKRLKEEHNKQLNVQTSIAANDVIGAVETIKQSMLDNSDMEVFTLTRPLVTLDTFQSDLKLFNHLYRNCKDMIFTFLPETGYFAFFRTQDAKEKFDDNELWRNKEMRDYRTVELYTGGAELIRKDGTKDYIIFDKIKL